MVELVKGFYLVKVGKDEMRFPNEHWEPVYFNGDEINGWEFCGQDAIYIDLEISPFLDIKPLELPK